MTGVQREKQGRKGRVRIISDQVQIGLAVITPRERERKRGERKVRDEGRRRRRVRKGRQGEERRGEAKYCT